MEFWPEQSRSLEEFVSYILQRGRELYRDLPWRNRDDAYEVLVSEVMLQQTQVTRVKGYWERFLKVFPTVDALAAASVADVLELWQGLGYNRRALALKRAADRCSCEYKGLLPDTYEGLLTLPGVGPATAAGVMVFAYQSPAAYLETNVRSVFLYELFPDSQSVSDAQLFPLVQTAALCPLAAADPRAWNYALLDYGAFLKTTVPNPSRRSTTHTRQSAFEGSRRQKRAWILRRVLAEPDGVLLGLVQGQLNAAEVQAGRKRVSEKEFASIVSDLTSEGFFHLEGDLLRA